MADKRKLQSDIDRNLKRVQEGRAAFQEILEKFESSGNQTQKEKFEGDLKKEIKKLQRLRDQIKTWLTANEVKDKRPLLDARKDIESDMERFKVIEKETKTKAYSKEGLLSTDAKKDPLQKEKEELDEWLKQCISSLNTQTEKYEFEIESLANSSKKKRIDKETSQVIAEKRQRLDLCLFHVEKLETIMRLLDNEKLECSKVRSLQEPIEYVIDGGDDASIAGYNDIYDDLRLDEIGDSSGITPGTVNTPLEHDLNGLATTTTVTNYRVVNDDAGSSASTHTSASNHTDSSVPHPGSSSSSNASSSRERAKSDEKVIPLTAVSASSTSTPLKQTSSSGSNPSGKHKASNVANQTAPPALMSQVVAGTPNKTNRSFGGQIVNGTVYGSGSPTDANSAKSRVHNETVSMTESSGRSHRNDPGTKLNDRHAANSSHTLSDQPNQHPSRNAPEQTTDPNCLPATANSATLVSSGVALTGNFVGTTSSTTATGGKVGFSTGMSSQAISHTAITNVTSVPSSVLTTSSLSTTSNQSKLTSSSSLATPSSANHIPMNLLQANALAAGQDQHFPVLLSNTATNCTLDGQLSTAGLDAPLTLSLASKLQSVVAAAANQGIPLSSPVIPPIPTQGQPPHVTMDKQIPVLPGQLYSQSAHRPHSYIQMHPRDVAAPFRNRNLDTTKGLMAPELLLQMQALEIGYRRLPHPCDTEKARMIVYKNIVPCPDYYPQEPLPGTDTEEYYMKLDAQTLFFIFYYFEGTRAQYFAAKALKRMSWRFHTKLMMWFQRHEEPKKITDEFESGSYIYYDYKKMSQQKNDQFLFHYSYLEDKDF